jgi:hypothetical protein
VPNSRQHQLCVVLVREIGGEINRPQRWFGQIDHCNDSFHLDPPDTLMDVRTCRHAHCQSEVTITGARQGNLTAIPANHSHGIATATADIADACHRHLHLSTEGDQIILMRQ